MFLETHVGDNQIACLQTQKLLIVFGADQNNFFRTEKHQCHASQDKNFARNLQSDALSHPLNREDHRSS